MSASQVVRVAREFAHNAEESGGRSMIIMGAGICQWFHGDATYRAILAMLILTGSMGRNGGGWAHYVGQEKCRPITGWATMAMATDWVRPPRQMIGTAYWYAHTDQWRYDGYRADALSSPLGRGRFAGMHTMDVLAASVAMGWMPFFPQFDRSSLDLADEADAAGTPVPQYVAQQLASGGLKLAVTEPDDPSELAAGADRVAGQPARLVQQGQRVLPAAPARHHRTNLRATPTVPELRPRDIAWSDEIPEGKLDLMLSIDFRMTSTTLLSDIVLPAATWYEKTDLSSTDMHPFVHAFSPAIDPPWESRSDFDAFHTIARVFSRLAKTHLGVRRDVVMTPMQHDTPGETAYPSGIENDWRTHRRDPGARARRWATSRWSPGITRRWPNNGRPSGRWWTPSGLTTKGITVLPDVEVKRPGRPARRDGARRRRRAAGHRHRDQDGRHLLALSGTTNGRLAIEGFQQLETPHRPAAGAPGRGQRGETHHLRRHQARPVPVITSPEWSGSETGGRRYAPFTVNVEELKPWHTLTGRMHFFLDHDWIEELGEQLPVYRPPLDMARLFDEPQIGSTTEGIGLCVRYLTPHSKWSIHSEYQDNLFMLSLSRGGPTMWMSPQDATKIGAKDNEWVEAVNRNGVMVLRVIISHRMPEGTVFVHHAQERTIDVPLSETNGNRGGIHNSLTRLLVKPSHLAGGYAQMSFAFNYLGPTGNQRDEVTMVRRRSQEVQY